MEAGSSDPDDVGVARRRAGRRDPAQAKRVPRAERDRVQTNPQSPIPNPKTGAVHLSLKTGSGVDELRAAMRAALEVTEPLRDAPIVSNVRHETLLRQARESIARAIDNLRQAGPSTKLEAGPSTRLGAGESASEELVLADIADGRRALEEVTGRRTSEDLLRRIFEKFCIGK
jgi:tRNA modification GTPase